MSVRVIFERKLYREQVLNYKTLFSIQRGCLERVILNENEESLKN